MQEKNLITKLSNRMGWTQQETTDMISALSGVISSRLLEGDVVSFQEFGQFESRKLKERVVADEGSEKHYLLPPELIPIFKLDDKWIETIRSVTRQTKEQQL